MSTKMNAMWKYTDTAALFFFFSCEFF